MPRESIRTFIALEIDEKTKEEITKIQDRIRQSDSLSGKWVQKDNLHLTLKFLGNAQLKSVESIKEKIKQSIHGEHAISCSLTHIGVFPNEKFPRVIWAGIEGENVKIINLAKRLQEALSEFGLENENRDFKTHITICRPKQITNRNKFSAVLEEINKNFNPFDFIINKITFFESKLTPKGPTYLAISNYTLL